MYIGKFPVSSSFVQTLVRHANCKCWDLILNEERKTKAITSLNSISPLEHEPWILLPCLYVILSNTREYSKSELRWQYFSNTHLQIHSGQYSESCCSSSWEYYLHLSHEILMKSMTTPLLLLQRDRQESFNLWKAISRILSLQKK